MQARFATYADVPALVDMAMLAHERSRYARAASLNLDAARRIARQSIAMDQTPDYGASAAFVVDDGEAAAGMLVGSIGRLYECLDVAVAYNFLLYVPDRLPGAADALLEAFETWATSRAWNVVVRIGITDAIVDPKVAGRWLRWRGWKQTGAVFEKEWMTCQQADFLPPSEQPSAALRQPPAL